MCIRTAPCGGVPVASELDRELPESKGKSESLRNVE